MRGNRDDFLSPCSSLYSYKISIAGRTVQRICIYLHAILKCCNDSTCFVFPAFPGQRIQSVHGGSEAGYEVDEAGSGNASEGRPQGCSPAEEGEERGGTNGKGK